MLRDLSIKEFYGLALAEGEGVGTAYEYYAKRLVLDRWLKGRKPPRQILIAGLPEKYGASFDFFQLAAELKTTLTVLDDRVQALEKAAQALSQAREQGWFPDLDPVFNQVEPLWQLAELPGRYDLALSSEVLQRIPDRERGTYLSSIQTKASTMAIFCPNASNPAHTDVSGLDGLRLEELVSLLDDQAVLAGYIDMPPFPPGITRSEEQREQATSGRMEAIAMAGLKYYARMERFIPSSIRKRQAHIVYGLYGGG